MSRYIKRLKRGKSLSISKDNQPHKTIWQNITLTTKFQAHTSRNLQEEENGRKTPQPLTNVVLNTLEQGSANFSKGSESKYFRFFRSNGLHPNYLALMPQYESAH